MTFLLRIKSKALRIPIAIGRCLPASWDARMEQLEYIGSWIDMRRHDMRNNIAMICAQPPLCLNIRGSQVPRLILDTMHANIAFKSLF